MFEKRKYKKYCEGKLKIVVQSVPDFLADCTEPGHIKHMEFKSGNRYNCRFVKGYHNEFDIWTGEWEITHDIQPLTFEQFKPLSSGTRKIEKK